MFRHLITGMNVKKLIEMQAKQNQTKVTQPQVQPTSGKKMVKKIRTRID